MVISNAVFVVNNVIPFSSGDENNFVHIKLEEEGDGALVSDMCH